MEELDGVPEIVKELKNKAKSYSALAKEARVTTGHKKLGSEQAFAQLQMENEDVDDEFKLPIQIEEKAIEEALKGGYNLKFHETFDKVGDKDDQGRRKHERFEVKVDNEFGSDDEDDQGSEMEGESQSEDESEPPKKKHHFFSDDEDEEIETKKGKLAKITPRKKNKKTESTEDKTVAKREIENSDDEAAIEDDGEYSGSEEYSEVEGNEEDEDYDERDDDEDKTNLKPEELDEPAAEAPQENEERPDDDDDVVLVPYLIQPAHEYMPGVPEHFMVDGYMPPPAAQLNMPHLMEYIYEPGWIY